MCVSGSEHQQIVLKAKTQYSDEKSKSLFGSKRGEFTEALTSNHMAGIFFRLYCSCHIAAISFVLLKGTTFMKRQRAKTEHMSRCPI